MNFDINNKVALVTGANRGIGKVIVEAFIEHGAEKVYLAVRNVESTRDLVERYGAKVVPVFVDIAQASTISELASQAPDVNIVVNNAGILQAAEPLSENSEEALLNEFTVNTLGLIRIAKAFSPLIEANGPGAFVQLNSVASIKNFLPFTTYSASKAASYSITQGLKDSLTPRGIQVLSVHPGPIITDMAVQAGMVDMGEPASVVAEGIVAALKAGDFHLFPDSMAKSFGEAYQSYAENIIEASADE